MSQHQQQHRQQRQQQQQQQYGRNAIQMPTTSHLRPPAPFLTQNNVQSQPFPQQEQQQQQQQQQHVQFNIPAPRNVPSTTNMRIDPINNASSNSVTIPMPSHQSYSTNNGISSNGMINNNGSSITMNNNGAYYTTPLFPLVPRKRTVKLIQLTSQGNLVVNVPVPEKILHSSIPVAYKQGEEFTQLRYTAATCDPDDFPTNGYTLRQQEYGRRTEIFIVVTMYNEDDVMFAKTMTSLMNNIAHLCGRNRSSTWGKDAWKKVVVCIVADGRRKVHPRVLNALGVMGVYQEGVMKNSVAGKDVQAHIFEYTTQISLETSLELHGSDDGVVPCQILFCLKENNAKKINSHRWFFNAFAPLLNPNVCVLIDVGTKPSKTSIYHLWKAFDRDKHVGGACGEIFADLGKGCTKLINPLVAAQNFEYKTSNILDKPLESFFGFISVLPGAFSAYRYKAVQGDPLRAYFRGELMHGGSDIFAANMYLAEDRILCFELVTKKNYLWTLKYVKRAKAETDVPDGVPEFVSQRRRWLNGSFFAAVHSLMHSHYIFRSGHSPLRKIMLCVQFLYNLIQLFFNWFMVANFYLTFYFLGHSTNSEERSPLGSKSPFVFAALRYFYMACFILIFVTSLGNRPQGSKFIYTACMILFAIIMGVMLYMTGFILYDLVPKTLDEWRHIDSVWKHRPAFRDMILSVASTYVMYLVSAILYFDPWHMITSFVQYTFLLPSYINILSVYSFCNINDVSWGTKGDNHGKPDLGQVDVKKLEDGKIEANVEMPTDQRDINKGYEEFLKALRTQPGAESSANPSRTHPTSATIMHRQEQKRRDAQTKQEDYFKAIRTRTVIAWVFSNATLIIVLTSELLTDLLFTHLGGNKDGHFNPYLKFIFYAVLGTSAFRFLGSFFYLITP